MSLQILADSAFDGNDSYYIHTCALMFGKYSIASFEQMTALITKQ